MLYRLSKKARFVTVQLNLHSNQPLFVTCLHLNHKTEPKRLKEINAIRKHLDKVFKEDHCQIWTGDFNAVTKEDYSDEKWQNITAVRKRNCWELPKTELTAKVDKFEFKQIFGEFCNIFIFQVKSFGFKDSWHLTGCPEPIKTCRFETHIDYVYANDKFLSKYKVQEVVHVDDTASDHNMVMATFVIKQEVLE